MSQLKQWEFMNSCDQFQVFNKTGAPVALVYFDSPFLKSV